MKKNRDVRGFAFSPACRSRVTLIGFCQYYWLGCDVLPKNVNIIVHTDPAHSYLEVTAELVHLLGINSKLSRHSFIDSALEKFFLECDVDGQLLVDALSEQYISFSFEERLHDVLCSFREGRSTGYLQ
jgi:hypothetical protein